MSEFLRQIFWLTQLGFEVTFFPPVRPTDFMEIRIVKRKGDHRVSAAYLIDFTSLEKFSSRHALEKNLIGWMASSVPHLEEQLNSKMGAPQGQ